MKHVRAKIGGVIAAGAIAISPFASQAAAGDIIDVAESAGLFDTLLTAVEIAGLTEALQGDGPLTLFAPTDDAFAAIDADTLNRLLERPKHLTNVLTYHVAAGEYEAADVVTANSIDMLNGDHAAISTEEGAAIAGSTITATDIEATNGVIHVLDSVMIPADIATKLQRPTKIKDLAVTDVRAKEIDIEFTGKTNVKEYQVRVRTRNGDLVKRMKFEGTSATIDGLMPGRRYIVQVRGIQEDGTKGRWSNHERVTMTWGKNTLVKALSEDGRFDTLVTAVVAAGLDDTLAESGWYTVFAPTDEAFAKIDSDTLNALLADEEALTDVLLYHVAAKKNFAEQVVGMSAIGMLNGDAAGIGLVGGNAYINDATIVETDIDTNNGVIHAIDTVIMPPSN